MIPDPGFYDNGILIVTGSRLRAEQADRPLAYQLQEAIADCMEGDEFGDCSHNIIVMSDLWYLNSEPLHKIPTISLGGPGVNAASARFYRLLPAALVVDNQYLIQMDLEGKDLRGSIWGYTHETTVNALNTFINNGYLEQFLNTVLERSEF